MGDARASKLSKLFDQVLNGKVAISPHNSTLFLEAFRSRTDAVTTVFALDSSPNGKDALQSSLQFNLTPAFMNDHAAPMLLHLQNNPGVAQVDSGNLLRRVLLKLVDPAVFWNPFRKAFLEGALSHDAQIAFAFLLLQLVELPNAASAAYRQSPDFPQILQQLLSSDSIDLRLLGQKIKHATDIVNADIPTAGASLAGSTPGGRHDNDFPDFRDISIVPTPDEIQSKEPPFLLPSDFLRDSSTKSSRVAMHLDNQFRLLREDMLYELREEIQKVMGDKKHKGRSTRVTGLKPVGMSFQEEPQPQRSRGQPRRTKCSLKLECSVDLDIFQGVEPSRRSKHIQDERNFMKHQSLACIMSEGGIVAFVTINRDIVLLARPKPVIVVQLEGKEGLKKLLSKLKLSSDLTLVQIDTALFAYEFVLKALQETVTLPLAEELLLWEEDADAPELEPSQQALPVVNALLANAACDLKPLLKTKDTIILDGSQSQSLLAGLVQRVSLIQGPPGMFFSSYISTLRTLSSLIKEPESLSLEP